MQPDLQSSLVCEEVRQEVNSKLILLGLAEVFAFPRFPVTVMRLCVVNRWCSGEGEFQQRSRIIQPDQTTVLVEGKEMAIRLHDSASTATHVEVFFNITFDRPGVHWVEVELDGRLIVRYPLRIAQLRAPGPGGPPPAPGAGTSGG